MGLWDDAMAQARSVWREVLPYSVAAPFRYGFERGSDWNNGFGYMPGMSQFSQFRDTRTNLQRSLDMKGGPPAPSFVNMSPEDTAKAYAAWTEEVAPRPPAIVPPGPLESNSQARGKYVFPVEGYKGIVQPHWGESNGGADLFAPIGTSVVSMGDGVVIGAGYGQVSGYYVIVSGSDGLQYYYAHLAGPPTVKRGSQLTAGAVIGAVGDTGNAAGTPPHLHIGIGKTILNGTGPTGGTGSNYNAVALLQQALGG